MYFFETPAKINTVLQILEKRADGYHELYMHMIPIGIFDRIYVQKKESNGIQLQISGQQIDGRMSDNLILKAAEAFQEAVSVEVHVSFHLEKVIPTGAGLGGGSGNAAGTLQVLNQLYHQPLSDQQIHQIGLQLGADVPFFLNPQPSEVRGVGEKITALRNYPSLYLLVIKPSVSIPTASAYRNCRPRPMTATIGPLTTISEVIQNLHNQFEETVFEDFPQLEQIRNILSEYGVLGALVSGSGSAIFGIFATQKLQKKAAEQLYDQNIGQIFTCQTLSTHSYYLRKK